MQQKLNLIALLFLCLLSCVDSHQAYCNIFDSWYTCGAATMDLINDDLKFEIKTKKAKTESVRLSMSNISFPVSGNYVSLSPYWLTVQMTVNLLTISKSNFQCIEEGAFNSTHFTELDILNIQNTPLQMLLEKSFIGLTNLKGFFLSDVQLHIIEPYVLAPMPNMEIFTLERCDDTVLSLDNFFGLFDMFRLNVILIHLCNLNDTIRASTFWGLQNITSLLLTENKITKMGPRSFDNVAETAKLINLKDNKLKSLKPDIFKYSQHIEVDLNGNPWHCGCDLEPMRKFIIERNNTNLMDVKCQTPPEHAGKYLDTLGPLCDIETPPIDFDLAGDQSPASTNMGSPNSPYCFSMSPSSTAVSSDDDFLHLNDDPLLSPIKQSSTISSEESKSNSSTLDVSYDHIVIACSSTKFHLPSNKLQIQNTAVLTKFDRNRRLRIRNENKRLIAHVEFVDIDSNFVGFELNDLWGNVATQGDKNKGNVGNSSNCFVKNGKSEPESSKITLEMALKHNKMYRFCWIKRFSTSIVPSDCMTFYSPKTMEPFEDDTWVSMDNRMKIVIIFIGIGVFACIVGILFALLLGCVFLKPIFKQDPNAQPAAKKAISNEGVENTDNTAERVIVI